MLAGPARTAVRGGACGCSASEATLNLVPAAEDDLAAALMVEPEPEPLARSKRELAEERMRAECATMPPEYQREKVFSFDAARYDFQGLAARILLESGNPDALQHIHLQPDYADAGWRRTKTRGAKVQSRWWAHGIAAGSDGASQRQQAENKEAFREIYGRFVSEVVAKELGCAELVYQRLPALRCHPPGTEPLGRPHRDEMYLRQPFEINIWLPLSPVSGTNSLWVESRRDAGDLHPLVIQEFGQCVRFWGSQVMHR
eukprot:SAG31_NODE_10133_length_1179_cov_1.348148_1_plen_258_part_00